MRRAFADALVKCAAGDKRIVLLSGDLGFGIWDEFQKTFPDRYVNCGAAEQAMLDIAAGLSLSGKIPFTYTITPFYLRALETIRTYIIHENLHVIMVGSGRNKDYLHDGYSHDATDIPQLLRGMGLFAYEPVYENELKSATNRLVEDPCPAFISLRR